MIHKTNFYSYRTGKIPEGCKLCVKGRKSVLFSTGICARDCFYCPISDYKKDNDVIFINELEIKELEINKLVAEVIMSRSKGIGITGGDPLSRINRVFGFIKILKERLGKKFHVHLYTSFNLVTEENLKKLYNAGLDEIRFHPDIDDNKLWKDIGLVKKFDWQIGIEVPIVPDKEKELLSMIDFFKGKVDFFNFNELEMADNKNVERYKNKYSIRNDSSYAVKDSYELGMKLIKYCDKNKLNCHFCSVKLKDKVQLSKRIKLRSKNSKLITDKVDKDGLLKRGVIYSRMIPGVAYENELSGLSPLDIKNELEELTELKKRLYNMYQIPLKYLFIDKNKLRILTSKRLAKKLSKIIPEQCATVIEYPTADQLTIEIDLLKP